MENCMARRKRVQPTGSQVDPYSACASLPRSLRPELKLTIRSAPSPSVPQGGVDWCTAWSWVGGAGLGQREFVVFMGRKESESSMWKRWPLDFRCHLLMASSGPLCEVPDTGFPGRDGRRGGGPA